jgi:ribosomal protein L7Ae-like RNA K-turn-binding protein
MNKNFLGSLGLCAKAGKLIYGVPMIIEAMQKGKKVYLVIEASDTSDNTHKRITDKCSFYGVETIRIDADCIELSSYVGKSSMLAAVAVTDEGFYKMVSKNLVDN